MARRNHFNKEDIKNIQKFIDIIDSDIKIYKGSCYSVDIYEEQIFLGNKRFDRVSQTFMEHWEEKIVCPMNWCVLSILHEVGHIMTDTEEVQDNRTQLDNIYSFMYQENILTEQEYFHSYFNIPAEKMATLWGIDYYTRNQKQCNDLAAVLGFIIK